MSLRHKPTELEQLLAQMQARPDRLWLPCIVHTSQRHHWQYWPLVTKCAESRAVQGGDG